MKAFTIFMVLFVGIFYVVGIGLFATTLLNAWRSTRAGRWPTVSGTINQLQLEEHPGEDGSRYEVKVRYAYAVDGVAYEGTRLAFGYGKSGGRKQHEEIERKLQAAQEVSVRYDPADPATSCLSFGLHRVIQTMLALSITVLLFIVGMTAIFVLLSLPDTVLLNNLTVR
jgi:hypothetical protein